MASALIEQTSQNEQTLKEVWATIGPDSCPKQYNFHMHTLCSDGQLHPHEVMEQAIAIGLQGLAITDHHTVKGYRLAQRWLLEMDAQPKPHLWTGVEITASLSGSEVHILGYAFDPDRPSISSYLKGSAPQGNAAKADRVIRAIQKAGGLAVLAHPERYRQPAKHLIPLAAELGIDGVETYYAYRHVEPWLPSPKETEGVKMLSDRYGLFNTCGTDTHGKNLLLRL